jgi:hypothetical protein
VSKPSSRLFHELSSNEVHAVVDCSIQPDLSMISNPDYRGKHSASEESNFL